MKEIPHDTRIMMESMRKSIAKAIDRSIRLGHYAVVWRDGKVAYIGNHPQAIQDQAMVRKRPSDYRSQE